jgi:hypothetical protein
MKVNIGPYKDEGDRKIEIMIHNYDTWSMDNTLALIALPMLKQLKKTKHGSPYVDPDDVPVELRPKETPCDDNGWVDETHHERWDWVMDQMIWSFQHEVDDDWEEQFFSDEEPQYAIKEIQWKGIGPAQLLLFPDEDGKTEEYEMYEMVRDETPSRFDKEGYYAYKERISNGFRLFGKYYEALWD